jgi:thiol-disulfide isomerase/thioredoxin
MRRTSVWLGVVLVLGGWLTFSGPAIGADRTAEEILKEFDESRKQPSTRPNVPQTDPAYKDYVAKARQRVLRWDALILELYKTAPKHERIPGLMRDRWINLGHLDAKAVRKEMDEILAHDKNPKLQVEGAFVKAQTQIRETQSHAKVEVSDLDAFLKLAPDDPRGPSLLRTASAFSKDETQKEVLIQRLMKEFPNSPVALRMQGDLRRREAIGKPFELEFTDAIKGSTVSIKGLKGKVVVIDFWATWCGPCIAEIPNMKKLYAEYRDKGVEFIGISLDQPKEQGGLDKLTAYVKKNEIEWPQYYQGNYWDSKFSSSWGVNSIPCVFVVDQDGKLFSVEARGKLDKMIPELLAKGGSAGQ